MRGLSGKRFIVAGGATGLGAALASYLVAAGGRVVVGDINENGLKDLASELDGMAGKAVTALFDLSDDASIARLVQRCVEEFGGLDGVANAGADLSIIGKDLTLMDTDASVFERTMRVNMIGHAVLMKEAIPHIKKAGGGALVSVSSAAAYNGLAEKPAYSCSKAALHALIRHTAQLVGPDNIRCNGVAPGLVTKKGFRTVSKEMIEDYARTVPLRRLGEGDDLAAAMAFLLSDESKWITGQILSVNGGSTFRD